MKFIGSTGTTIIGLAFGGATFMALQVLVSPLFWSSLSIDESCASRAVRRPWEGDRRKDTCVGGLLARDTHSGSSGGECVQLERC